MLRNCYQGLHFQLTGYIYRCKYSTKNELLYLCKHLNICEEEAKYLCTKHPVVKKITESKIKHLLDTLYYDLGYKHPAAVLREEPLIFSILPVTLKHRYNVLTECGFVKVSPSHVTGYLSIIKQKSIRQLQESGCILNTINVENRLASCLTQWPTSLTTLINGEVNSSTLYKLRLQIIQHYLKLVLDLSSNEFYRGIQTYPTMKHRPLTVIRDTLTILLSEMRIPPQKIKANLYLIHANPDNLKNIMYKFYSIGDVDIKEVIRLYPKIAMRNCSDLVEIKNILKEFHIDNEAQRKCFEIYTLAATTIRERLERARTIPELNPYFNHPRFLKVIYYNKTAMKRLTTLYKNNKKCVSLNILSGGSTQYETFVEAPGDSLYRGKDLIFFVSQCLDNKYKTCEIYNVIKKHPFWMNIPLVQIKLVFIQLSTEFSHKDIYQNCIILLYPLNKIKETLLLFKRNKINTPFHGYLNMGTISNAQKISLVLYLLEKEHHFTGNGVWTEEKS